VQAAFTPKAAVLITVPAVAVIVTPIEVGVETVVRVNDAELLPEIVTDAGTVTTEGELFERPTVKLPEVTGELRVTVHMADWPPETKVGLQEIPVNVGVA
jgi:hypothetical protein